MNLGNTLILGDSYSTFEGKIPDGYETWYSKEGFETGRTDVSEYTQTWVYKVFDGKDNILVLNDSFSGTTVSNSVRPHHTVDVSFLNRLNKLINGGFFQKNRIDTVLVFGGTNDSYTDAPIGEDKFDNFTEEDLFYTLPAFSYIAKKLNETVPDARVCYLINTELKYEITTGIMRTAEHFGQDYLLFKHLDKKSGHPSVKGMEQIAEAINVHFE